jgi:hypothetical protein
MGRSDHGRMAAHRRASASPLTSPKPSLRSRKDPLGACGNPGSRPPAGPLSYPDAKIALENEASQRSAPATNPDEGSGLVVAKEEHGYE